MNPRPIRSRRQRRTTVCRRSIVLGWIALLVGGCTHSHGRDELVTSAAFFVPSDSPRCDNSELQGAFTAIRQPGATSGKASVEVSFDNGALISVDGKACKRITPNGPASCAYCFYEVDCGGCLYQVKALGHESAWWWMLDGARDSPCSDTALGRHLLQPIQIAGKCDAWKAFCGNGVCEPGESLLCKADCETSTSGDSCGNDVCEPPKENQWNGPFDCPYKPQVPSCSDGLSSCKGYSGCCTGCGCICEPSCGACLP